MGNILQGIGAVLLLGSYIPQIIKLLKTKNAQGVSLLFWIVMVVGLSAIGINMYLQGVNALIFGTQVLNAFLAFIILVLVYKYQK